MDEKTIAIIDAAVEVAHFSKTHEWPKEGSPEFFEFAQKLDVLATAITARFPGATRWGPCERGNARGWSHALFHEGKPVAVT